LNSKDASPALTVQLGLLIALPALGTDLYVAAMPAVAQGFAAPVDAVQFTLTAYLAGIAAGQLLWGPLSDRFGRKPVLAVGITAMLIASVAAMFAASIAALAAARLAQGVAMSSGALIGRTIVRDLYAHEQAARMLARMTVVFSLVPVCAPLGGALLTGAWGWPAVFAAMALVAAALLFSLSRLSETAPAERRSVHPVEIARTLGGILAERAFRGPFLVILCAHMGILAWVSNSSFTLVRGLGVSPVNYGLLFALVMLGQIGGSWAASRLVLRLGIARLIGAGAWLMALGGLAGAALAWGGVAHWAAVVLPFMVFLFGTALILPGAMAAALTPFPHSAGSASSVIGAIGFTLGAVISTLLGLAFDGTARPIATVAALAGLGALFFQWRLSRGPG
jgi:DHA1 family bicyclomycin/chloramphenicol resistance-like MFS transporter